MVDLLHVVSSYSFSLLIIHLIHWLLLCGSLPFYDDDEDVIFDKILDGAFEFSSPIWNDISVKAKDFISKCLQENPLDRPTSFDLIKHSWLCSPQVKLNVEDEMNELKNRFSFDTACGYIAKQGNTMG